MSLFCFLWIPLFYLFWRSISEEHTPSREVWAFLFGCIFTFIQFFFGPFIVPGGFGLHRWLSGSIDIVVLPVLLPLLIYFCLNRFSLESDTGSFVKFALVWLLPVAIINSLFWSSRNDPVLLIIVPILWTAIAVGVPFFISLIQGNGVFMGILSCLGIIAVPFAATSSYWAFFSNRTIWGVILLLAATAPALVSVIKLTVNR